MRHLAKAGVFFALILLGIAGQFSRWSDVFLDGKVFFVDPDCYSRMTRVALLLDGGGPSIRFHEFENAPVGVAPHTTAPLDLLIAGGARTLGFFEKNAAQDQARDLAGALVSPVLGVLTLLMVACWAWRKPFGSAALFLVAASPILAHGFSVGRPDHQSLLLFLLTGALIAELEIWNRRKIIFGRGIVNGRSIITGRSPWGVVSAVCWGIALWVSLFEPLILLVSCLVVRAFLLGRNMIPRFGANSSPNPARFAWLAPVVFLGIVGFALLFDGFRGGLPSAEVREYFSSWSKNIGELQPVSWSLLAGWLGWFGVLLPVVLLYGWIKSRDPALLASAIVLLFLLVLTSATARWGYFSALFCALCLPSAMSALPRAWMAWIAFLVSLWPVASTWDRQLFPEGMALRQRTETRQENILLRETAGVLRKSGPGIVMAPWWICPPLAYWSGRPFVAGSSHQSLPGTVDTARFFLSSEAAEAEKILRKRQVTAVITDDPTRVVENSAELLGIKPPSESLAKTLSPKVHPEYLKPGFRNAFFTVYQVVGIAPE